MSAHPTTETGADEVRRIRELAQAIPRSTAHRRHPIDGQRTPERNAPCPCGSGSKFKRCCRPASAVSPYRVETGRERCQRRIALRERARESLTKLADFSARDDATGVIGAKIRHTRDHSTLAALCALMPRAGDAS